MSIRWVGMVTCVLLLVPAVVAADGRSPVHEEYAATLWSYLVGSTTTYKDWDASNERAELAFVPTGDGAVKTYWNKVAASDKQDLPTGSLIVTEHFAEGRDEPVSITVCYRVKDGYHRETGDWYWASYLPGGKVIATVADKPPFAKHGFVTFGEDGRLWVFRPATKELADFLTQGELAKHVIRPGAGPGGMTLKSPDGETIDAYLTAAEGFVTKLDEGRVWVFREHSPELADFEAHGEPAKIAIRPAAGPQGMTVKGPDAETIDAYLRAVNQ